jgi:hypothetical protein
MGTGRPVCTHSTWIFGFLWERLSAAPAPARRRSRQDAVPTVDLCRKRPSPLEKGRASTWACGVTQAIGIVNFLFDPSQTPHMKAADLYRAFGLGQSTGQGKSKLVRDLLKMGQLDPEWTLPSRVAHNADGVDGDGRRHDRGYPADAARASGSSICERLGPLCPNAGTRRLTVSPQGVAAPPQHFSYYFCRFSPR